MESAWTKLKHGSRPVAKMPLRWRRKYDKAADHTPPATTRRPKTKKKPRQRQSSFTFTTKYEIPLDANGDLTSTNSKGQTVTFPRKFFSEAGHIVALDDYCHLTRSQRTENLPQDEFAKAKAEHTNLSKTLDRLIGIAMARSQRIEEDPQFAASAPKHQKTIKIVTRWKVSS
jgi:hypothetical protein